jgi:hypothetical protein
LSELNLQFNNINDASVLSSLPNLKRVDIRNNPYYLKKFIVISSFIIGAIVIISFILRTLLYKYRPNTKRLCLRTKISIFCCFFAPLTLWFSGYYLRYLLLGSTMIAQNNLFVLGPMFGLLIAGFVSTISVLIATKRNQNCMSDKTIIITVLLFHVMVTFLCLRLTMGFLLRNA